MKQQTGFGAVGVLIVIVVLAILGGTGWLVYQRQTDPEPAPTTQQTTQNTVEESDNVQTAEPTATTEASNDVVLTVQNFKASCASGAGLKVCGEVTYKKATSLTELWVAYGKTATLLDKASTHITPVTAEATAAADTVMSGFNINYSDLEYSTKYYYQVTAKTATGTTVVSSVDSFTTVAN